MTDEQLIPVFVPPLIALLLHEERSAGRPLTEGEVLAVRDGGTCVMLRASVAGSMAEERGYDDLDPERAWEDWQSVREQLADGGS